MLARIDRAWSTSHAARRRATTPRRSTRPSRSSSGSATRTSCSLGYREYAIEGDSRRACDAGRAGLGPRHPPRRGFVGVRRTASAWRRRARGAAACRGRRPADGLEDESRLDRAPACADGLHRPQDGRGGRQRDRRAAPARPLHLEGVHGAGGRRADRTPEAAPGARSRGPRCPARTTTRSPSR